MRKIFPIAFFLLLGLTFLACENNTDNASDANAETATPVAPSNNTMIPPPPAATTNTSGVEHYTCPNGHVGSGGSNPGNCTQCGTELAHNQAFHNAPATTTTTNPSSPVFQTTPGNAAQPQASPAQNSAGVWHYTCAAGCAGGSGAQGNCATCGGELAHNQAYHN